MKEIKALLIKPQVKAFVHGIITLVLGVISSILANNLSTWYWWLILSSTAILYIYILVRYSSQELSAQQKLLKKENELQDAQINVDVFRGAFIGINAICKLSSKQTNLKIHEIVDEGKIYCDNWNFEIASGLLCKEIYDHIICRICNKNGYTGNADIEVEYVCLVDLTTVSKSQSSKSPKNRAEKIKLCGYYHPSRSNPTIYRKIRNIGSKDKNGKQFFDASLFEEKKNEISILLTETDIKNKFGFLSDNYDYSQYVGIPVFCETVSGENKMIGLLEIVCHQSSVISTNITEIKKYVDLYLSTYSSLFLLLYKSDKALRATPKPLTKK